MITSFRKPVVNAMRAACDDMLRFSGNPSMRINAEYLFTVAVAKQIDKLNSCHGDPYQIYLEKRARDFARDCLHPIKFGNPMQRGASILRKGFPRISRDGRIDIAVYENIANSGYLGSQPICAIELKGFNPAKNLALKDLRRNLEYFSLAGYTGSSVLTTSLFGALHCWSRLGPQIDEEKKCASLQRRYEGWLAQLSKPKNVRSSVTVHEVRKNLEGDAIEEGDYFILDADTIHNFVGVVVEFSVDVN